MTNLPLIIEDESHVRVFRLNRPDQRNALNSDLIHALTEAVLDADEDPQVRSMFSLEQGMRHSAQG